VSNFAFVDWIREEFDTEGNWEVNPTSATDQQSTEGAIAESRFHCLGRLRFEPAADRLARADVDFRVGIGRVNDGRGVAVLVRDLCKGPHQVAIGVLAAFISENVETERA
jgi:hypothetical protein